MDFMSQTDVRTDDNIRIEAQEYIQSQYSASPAICTLLADFRSRIKTDVDLTVILKKWVDVDTATGVALDNLGRIVDMSRTLELEDGSLVLLDDDQYRRLLKYKFLANIGDATADTINVMLNIMYEGADNTPKIFTLVREAIDENGNYYNAKPMHVRWFINGTLDDVELALFRKGGTLCLGAGVGYDVVAVDPSTFGFLGSELLPFNQGIFWDGSYLDHS